MEAATTISSTARRSKADPIRFSRTKPEGFTLVEIILAVAIAAVVMGGGAVLLTSGMGEDDFADARRALEEAAQSARTQALQNGQDQFVLLFTNGVGGAKFGGGTRLVLITSRDVSRGERSWANPERAGTRWFFSRYGWLDPIRMQLRAEGRKPESFTFAALTGELIPEATP